MSPPAVPLNPSPAASAKGNGRQSISYVELMKPDEDWRMLPDASERRKIQNRLAQRAYRRNMRDRTKELEKVKKELAQLQSKEGSADGAASVQEAEQSHAAGHHEVGPTGQECHYDGLALQQNMDSMSMVAEWADNFPQQWSSGMDSMDPAFFTCTSPPPQQPDDCSVASSRSRSTSASSKKRRISSNVGQTPPRTNTGSSTNSTSSHRHSRSRPHTPLPPSPSPKHAATMPSPNPATMAELQQASQLLTLSPYGDGSLDTMSLPQLDSDSAFMDGFLATEQQSCSAPSTFHPDQGLWTGLASPPLPSSSTYGSYLTPSPPADSSSSWTSQPGGSPHLLPTSPDDLSHRPTATRTSYASSTSSLAGQPSPSLSQTSTTTTSSRPPSLSKAAAAHAQSSLLHLAVAGGHAAVLKMLLQRCDIPLDARDAAGYTALQRAVFAGRGEMVALLLEHGADFGAGGGVDGAVAAGKGEVVAA